MKRIIAIFISITLLCGTTFSALNLYVKTANASVPSTGYFDDLVSDAIEYVPSQNVTDFNNKITEIESMLDDPYSIVFVLCDTQHRYFYFGYFKVTTGTNMSQFYWYSDNDNLRFRKNGNTVNYAFFLGTAICVFDTYQSFTYSGSSLANSSFNIGTFGSTPSNLYFPSTSYAIGSTIECYTSKEIQNSNGVYISPNLVSGSFEPDPEEYNLVDFYVGTNRFLTLDDQYVIRELERADVYNTYLYLFFDEYDDSNSIAITSADLVVVENPTLYTNALQNISPAGAYCINITDWDYDYIFYSTMVEVGEDYSLVYANCLNCPYDLVHGKIEPDERQVNIYNTFMEYYNNYNTTQVIPQQLGDYLFGISGSMLYPCNVSMPSVIAQYDTDMTVTANINTFTWSMIEPDSLAYNYELFDTVIVPASLLGSYSLVYFYDSTLTKPYHFIDYEEFDSLLESFDCIIIIPDDNHTLEGHGWWNDFLPSWVTDWDDLAVSGTSSRGVEYKDSVSGNLYLGFCLVTKKAIQKQMLYNFNDGITKTYDLMVQYVETEDNWKSDFLLWSASMFTELNSVWGELDLIHKDLNNFFQSVLDKLDQLVNNTDEAIHSFWILPLYNFVKTFEPSLTGFANWIDAIEDFGDDLPELPPITVVPAIPTNFPLIS